MRAVPAAPDAVVFDMDGVLIDSGAHHRASWRALCADLGVEPPHEFWRLTIGRPAEEAVQNAIFNDSHRPPSTSVSCASLTNQSTVNPSHTVGTGDLLNEYATSTIIGAYRKRKTRAVQPRSMPARRAEPDHRRGEAVTDMDGDLEPTAPGWQELSVSRL